MIFLIGLFVFGVTMMIGQLEVFSKAGQKWWMGLIPVYSSWILITKVAKLNALWFILDLVMALLLNLEFSGALQVLFYVLNFFVVFVSFFNIAKKFHLNPIVHGILGGLTDGLWLIYIGLSRKAKYDDNVVVSSNGPF